MLSASSYSSLSAHVYEEGSKLQKSSYKNARKYIKLALKNSSYDDVTYIKYNSTEIYLDNKDFKSALKLLEDYSKDTKAFILEKDKENWLNLIYKDENIKRRERILYLVNNLKYSDVGAFGSKAKQ